MPQPPNTDAGMRKVETRALGRLPDHTGAMLPAGKTMGVLGDKRDSGPLVPPP